MTIPQTIFSPCHGVLPLRPRLENWMAELLQDRRRLDALTDRFGVPLNIQSVDPFRRNIAQLTDCVTDYGLPFLPMFARKANKCLSYVQAARDMGIGIDTASHAEVEQCLEQGLPGDRIVCTAAVKDRALMTLCVGGGVTVILDNEDELELLEDVAEGATKPVSVGLRLNGFERDGTKLYSRFGFPLTQVPTLAARIGASETLRLDGLHFHLNGYSAEDRIAAILQTLPLIHKIKGDSTAPFFLDIGGGIPMNYLDDKAEWETWLAELDRALAGDRLDAPHAGCHTCFGFEFQQSHIPSSADMRSAAQLGRKITHPQHPDTLTVFFTKESQSTFFDRIGKDHFFASDLRIVTNMGINQVFNVSEYVVFDRASMREVETQSVRRHQ